MKGANIVQSAVKKASKASKRKGKWVNLQEIRSKTPKTNKEPIPPILRYLSREDRIEKKRNFQLWRPKDNNGMFSRAVGAAIVSRAAPTVAATAARSTTQSAITRML